MRNSFGASIIAFAAGIVWSLGAILARKADGADAFQYLVWRSIGIIVVLELVAIIRRRPPMMLRAFTSGRVMLYANLGLLLASFGFVYAVKTTSAANAAFLSSLTPLMTSIIAFLVLGERLTKVTVITLIVAMCGLLVMVVGDLSAGNQLGNLAALASSVGFAIYAVSVRSNPHLDWSPVMPGYALLMIILCATITLANGRTLLPSASDVVLPLIHGGLLIVVGTTLFNWSTRHLAVGSAAVFAQSEMVFIPLWGVLFLGERPPATTYLGGAIILGAVAAKTVLDSRLTRAAEANDAPVHAL